MPYSAFPTPQQVAVQLAATNEFGVAKVDGTTITAPGGVLSASNPAGMVTGPGTTVVGDFALWNNTLGTLLKDATPAQATAALNLFTSVLQGLVPASGGGTVNYLRADATFANPLAGVAAAGLVYLGTVSVSAGALSDTTILAANNSAYRSFKLIGKNIVPGTNSVTLFIQVHSGGAFQTTATSYASTTDFNNGSVTGGSGNAGSGVFGINLSAGGVQNVAPGVSFEATVSNLSAATIKMWNVIWGHPNNATTPPAITSGNAAGMYNTAAAIDGFQIVASSGTLSSGSVDIYGVL